MAFKKANDAVASNKAFLLKKQYYKYFLHVMANQYVPIFWDADVCGGRKLIKNTHMHTGQLL